jgi:hypothetical protein
VYTGNRLFADAHAAIVKIEDMLPRWGNDGHFLYYW